MRLLLQLLVSVLLDVGDAVALSKALIIKRLLRRGDDETAFDSREAHREHVGEASPTVEACIYDSCPVVRVWGAAIDEINGDYYPDHLDCKSTAYGSENGLRWVGYRRPLSDATLEWYWQDKDHRFRGWSFHVTGHLQYFDSLHRGIHSHPPQGVWLARNHTRDAAQISNRCLELKDIRGHRPALTGASQLLAWVQADNFDGLTYFDLADQLPRAVKAPFAILFTAAWDVPHGNTSGCVLDIGSGDQDNNVAICNEGTAIVFSVFYDFLETRLEVPDAIEPGKRMQWLFSLSSSGKMRGWRDGRPLGEMDGAQLRPVWREHFYLGRSLRGPNPESRFFRGSLENFHMWTGEVLSWSAGDIMPPRGGLPGPL